MSKSYIVILQYLWCKETGGGIEYTSDCVKFDKRDKAIRNGFKLRESDEFNIGVIDGGKLISFDWMDKPVGESEDTLAQIAELIGAAGDEQVEALEKAQRYIEELREWNAGLAQESFERQQRIVELQQGCENDPRIHEIIDLKERIAELESRNVTVKLPKPHAHLIWIQAGHAPDDYWDDVAVSHSERDRCCDGSERYPVYTRWEIEEMLTAAGIKVEAE